MGTTQSAFDTKKLQSNKSKNKKEGKKAKTSQNSGSGEVLLELPGGFKYKLPGKKQRIAVGAVVLGLNILFLLAVLAFFYIPNFHAFIYNFGRS